MRLLLFCAFVLCSFFQVHAQEKLPRSVSICAGYEYPTHLIGASLVEALYARLGIRMRVNWVLDRRSLILANNGKCDGDLMRAAGITDPHSNLVPVSPPILLDDAVAYAIGSPKDVYKKPADLKGHRIGIIGSEPYAVTATKGLDVQTYMTYGDLFGALRQGEIDVAYARRLTGLLFLKSKFADSGIRQVSGPLEAIPTFHILHKKHDALKSSLVRELKRIRSSGEDLRIIDKSLQQLIQRQASKS